MGQTRRRYFLLGRAWAGRLVASLVCLSGAFAEGQSLGEAVNAPELIWETGGTSDWSVTTNVSVDGVVSVQASLGQVANGESWLQTTNPGSQAVTFWWKLDSPSTYDFLELFAGNNLLASWNVKMDWHPRSVLLPGGEPTLTWKLRRQYSMTQATTGWIDQISFGPALEPSFVQDPTNQTVLAGDQITLAGVVIGTEPVWLQWLQNGTNVPAATNETLKVTTIQEPNAGDYQLVATNLYGAVTSAVATVTVIPSAPRFVAYPESRGVFPGGIAYFVTETRGSDPRFWQWFHEGSAIPGATSYSLTISNVLPADYGLYTVVVSNAIGQSACDVTLGYSTVGAWGWPMSPYSYGHIVFPSDTTNVVALAGGDSHSIGLRRDGTVVGWGRFGFPIDGVTNAAPVGATNVVSIGAGSSHCLAARDDGSVTFWGEIYYDGSTNVPPTATNVAAIALGPGAQHALVLRNDGTVVDWGISGLKPPAQLTNAASANVVSVAAGDYFGVALKADGTVVMWPSGPTVGGAVAIACGWEKFLVLKTNGTVVEWYGTTPPAGLSNVVAIAGGASQSLALRCDGTVVTWGASTLTVPDWATNIAAIACMGHGDLVLLAEGPPCFTPPLVDRSVAPTNGLVIFNAVATGEKPLNYQWWFNGTELPGETNNTLVLKNVNASQLGSYSLSASNRLGTAFTRSASLTFSRAAFRQGSVRVSGPYFYFTADGPTMTRWRLQTSTNGVTWSDGYTYSTSLNGSFTGSAAGMGSSSLYRLVWVP